MPCPHCRHCAGDHPTVDDVRAARAVLARYFPTLHRLQRLAPTGALGALLRWVEAQAGTRGRRVIHPGIVTDDGEWTELEMPRAPEVYRKRSSGDPDPERIGA